jgi:hypothetical protein
VIAVKLKSTKKPPKPVVWVTEIGVKDRKVTPTLIKLIDLVKKYEGLS